MSAMLSIDGIENKFPENISNLENLLSYVIQNKKAEGDIIVEVKVDGQLFTEEYKHQAKKMDVNLMNKIDIATQTSSSFACDFLKEIVVYIDHLKKGILSSIELLRDNKEEEGYDMLFMSMDFLIVFKAHLNNIWLLTDNADKQNVFDVFFKRFGVIAEKIIVFQEMMDSLSVANLLEEEILTLVMELKDEFDLIH